MGCPADAAPAQPRRAHVREQAACCGDLGGFFLAWRGECDLTRGLVGKSLKALVNTAVI